MDPIVLVTGFGPFLDVVDNPASRLARTLDGWRAPGVRVVGRELPVSYARAPELCAAWAEELDAVAVLGVGVARGRTEARLERRGVRDADPALADVDDVRLAVLDGHGPEAVELPDTDALAAALGVGVSEDAGRYVCNAWIYRVARRLPGRRIAFLHVPPEGLSSDRIPPLLFALAVSGRNA